MAGAHHTGGAGPLRLTRSRKRGARTPPGAVYVGRPTLWGNPFTVARFGHAKCVILHRQWLDGRLGDLTLESMGFYPAEIETLHRKRSTTLARLHQLAGRDLSCWCPQSSDWCHATTLIEMAMNMAEIERLAA